MNRQESILVGFLATGLILVACLSIYYYMVLDNLIQVVQVFNYNLQPVRNQLFVLVLGLSIIGSINGGINVYHYSRRGKDVNG